MVDNCFDQTKNENVLTLFRPGGGGGGIYQTIVLTFEREVFLP